MKRRIPRPNFDVLGRISVVGHRLWDYNQLMQARVASLALLLLVTAGARGQSLHFPTPPQQSARWNAPDTVPTNLLSAVTTLFAQGFPDPRGCDYRQVTVEVGSVWGEARGFRPANNTATNLAALRVETRGWVLPATVGSTQRFAICWNGLIYPLVELGPSANLAEEIGHLPRWTDSRFYVGASPESRSVISTNAGSSRILLLLRSGFAGAAMADWQAFNQNQFIYRSPNFAGASARTNNLDPYLTLAGDWAWAMFDRAVCAHMRGSEAQALADAKTLTGVRPEIEAEAARRGFSRQPYYDASRRNQERPYLDFLEPLPQLLTDLERRAREGERIPALTSGLTNWPSAPERIAVLIRDLDLVAARHWGQPGGVTLTDDPVVAALVNEGDAAVPALIDCLATDQRLTRSVSSGRDFHRNRNLIPVSHAARAALRAILQTDLPTAAAWRAYWERFHGMRIEERWFTVLQDDRAGLAGWLEVANGLTRTTNLATWSPAHARLLPSSPATNAPALLSGEWLRLKSQPSVSELLARRALEISPTNAASYDLGTACEIALRLAVWDPKAAAPVATRLVRLCRTVNEYSGAGTRRWGGEQPLGAHLAKLTLVRERAGEAGALEDYAAWLRTATPQSLGYSLTDCLQPLTAFPTNPAMQTLAEGLFGKANSPWGKLPWPSTGSFNPMTSGLLQLSAFRQLLVRELEVKTMAGASEWQHGWISYQLTNAANVNGSLTLALSDSEQPAPGAKAELRWCDWIALNLAQAKQIPAFNPFAPLTQRDGAIQQAQARLQRKESP